MLCGEGVELHGLVLDYGEFMGCTSRVYHTLKLKSGAEGTCKHLANRARCPIDFELTHGSSHQAGV